MAYADIPVSMRPAFTELSPHNPSGPGFSALAAAAAGGGGGGSRWHLGGPASSFGGLQAGGGADAGAQAAGAVGGGEGAGGVAGGIKATQVELVRGALLGCLKMLRQMSEALGE